MVLVLLLSNPLASVSDDPLLGETVPLPLGRERAHTGNPADLVVRPGEPPAGGPHFAQPQCEGIYDQQVGDGYAIHALEHGLIWISYNPDLVDDGALRILEDVAGDFRRDVILSPRPLNAMPVAAVAWGRILRLDEADEDLLRDFIRTNRDRGPEGSIRTPTCVS